MNRTARTKMYRKHTAFLSLVCKKARKIKRIHLFLLLSLFSHRSFSFVVHISQLVTITIQEAYQKEKHMESSVAGIVGDTSFTGVGSSF